MSQWQDLAAAAVEDRRRDGYSLQKVSQADKNIPADDEGLVFFKLYCLPPLLSCIKNFQRQAKVFLKSILMHSGYTTDTQLHEHGTNNKNENHKNLADQIAWVFIICEA